MTDQYDPESEYAERTHKAMTQDPELFAPGAAAWLSCPGAGQRLRARGGQRMTTAWTQAKCPIGQLAKKGAQ